MARFIIVTFAALAVVFYEMSGGSDFEAGSYIEAKVPEETPEPRPQVARTAVSPATDPVLSVPRDEDERVAEIAEPAPTRAALEAELDLSLSEARVPTALEDPQVIAALAANSVSLLEVGIVPEQDAAPVAPASLPGLTLDGLTGDEVAAAEPAPATVALAPTFQVTGTRVNMRAGPGTEYSVVAQLVRGDAVEVMYDDGNGWLQLRDIQSNDVGWMSDRFVAPD